MSISSYFSSSPSIDEFQHDLEPGDHVIRWTRIVVYPIQVHGIVLSAVDDAVTIVDFGVSSDAVTEKIAEAKHDEAKHDGDVVPTKERSFDQDTALEDAISAEEKEMMKVCENYEGANKNRINIISITTMKDIQQWKKVNYGKKIKKGWKWWWKSDDEDLVDADVAKTEHVKEDDSRTNEKGDNKDDNLSEHQPLTEAAETGNIELSKNSPTANFDPKLQMPPSQTSSKDKPPKNMQPPELPESDPKILVLARVRYLLQDPSVLPKHNLFFSNSECIAVWCKTGRWSTLQASIFLGGQVAVQLKSTATIATVVGNVTVTQVVPAGGAAGWFGLTTTTTVGLLTVQPWLIPVLAGYGILAVGTPMFLLRKAKRKWEKNTRKLTDGFWAWADTDVYVEAIKTWSAVGR